MKKDRDDMKRQRDSIKPEYEERIHELEEKLTKTRKDNETLRAQNKKFEKERNEGVKKLQENQKMWAEIEQSLDDEDDDPKDDESQNDRQILNNSQPKRISKFILEKLKENEKILTEQVTLMKQLEQKEKKIKKLTNEIQQINSQTLELMQKLSEECLQDELDKKAPKLKKKVKNHSFDMDDLKSQFDKIDPKTIALSAQTIEHINSTLTFLTCENTALQQQITKMQQELNSAQGVKSEILTDFDKIKEKV